MIWGGSLPLPLLSPLGFLVLAVLVIVSGVVVQRRHSPQWTMWTLGAAIVVIPLAAYAGTIATPNTFTNGTVADAGEVNANFSAVETAVNDNDARITTAQGTADTAVTNAATAQGTANAAIASAGAAQGTATTALADAATAQSTANAAQGTANTTFSWGNHASAGYVVLGQPDSITSTMIAAGQVSSSDLQGGACLAEIADDDGAGSGLDSDLLDGLEGSDLALAGHTHPGASVTIGKVYLTTDGTICSTDGGTRELYWNETSNVIQVINSSGDWLDFWWQSQKGSTTAGSAGAHSAGTNTIISAVNTNTNGFEIHFGQADGTDGWCSVWLQYANSRMVGHYILY
jgi:hypothetical protein